MDHEGTVMMQCLAKQADTGKPVDMFQFITRAALDIICHTAMGFTLNAQTAADDKEHPYVTAVYKFV
jgi:cytochrome P450